MAACLITARLYMADEYDLPSRTEGCSRLTCHATGTYTGMLDQTNYIILIGSNKGRCIPSHLIFYIINKETGNSIKKRNATNITYKLQARVNTTLVIIHSD